jgi:hypothetical protein
MFDNAEAAPRGSARPRYCAPRREAGRAVNAVRAHLAERAHQAGFARPAVLRRALTLCGTHRITIPAGASEVHLRSPQGHTPGDRRTLGALIAGVTLDATALDPADRCFRRGFHPIETHGARRVRWTTGDAVLAFPAANKPRRLVLEIAALAPPAPGKSTAQRNAA